MINNKWNYSYLIEILETIFAQSAGPVEYTDCFSTEGKTAPQRVSWKWHLTIWWRDSSNAGALENVKYPFIAITPRSTQARRDSTWEVPIYGLNRTNGILMLNWIVCLNWIAWNRNVFDN